MEEKKTFIESYKKVYLLLKKKIDSNLSPQTIENNISLSENIKIAIHHFIAQILSLGMIISHEISKNIELSDKESIEPIIKSKLETIFNSIFKNYIPSIPIYPFIINQAKKILISYNINPKSLPNLFEYHSHLEFLKEVNFNSIEIANIYKFLWKPFKFSLKEDIEQKSDLIDDKATITPKSLEIIYLSYQTLFQKNKRQLGIFYTPDSEIKYTLLTSLYYYFSENEQFFQLIEKQNLFKFLYELIYLKKIISIFSPKFITYISNSIYHLKILDPACGSGSFLIYTLGIVLNLKRSLNQSNENWEIPLIYGVDVNPWAIQLTLFRLWAKIYCDDQKNISQTFQKKLHLIQGDFILENQSLYSSSLKFNLIIGNPPYLRHRDISNPNFFKEIKYENYIQNDMVILQNEPLSSEIYRKNIKKIGKFLYNDIFLETNRFDYYIYFYLFGINQLAEDGILGFIVSNSWMTVKYGYTFQEFLCKKVEIKHISDNQYRSFSNAEINTIISIFKFSKNLTIKSTDLLNLDNLIPKNIVNFIQWKISYSKIFTNHQTNEIFKNFIVRDITEKNEDKRSEQGKIKIFSNKYAKSLSLSQKQLYINPEIYQDNSSDVKYYGYNWTNIYFNSSPLYFALLKHLNGNIIFLQDIAQIRRGLTTNCNDFFVLYKKDKTTYENGYGDIFTLPDEVLSPFLESPKQLTRPTIEVNEIKSYLFNTILSKDELKIRKMNSTLKYIQYGEEKIIKIKKGVNKGKKIQGIYNLASFKKKYIKSSSSWYCLKSHKNESKELLDNKKKIIIQKIYNTTYKIALIDEKIKTNNTFYEIHLKNTSYDYCFTIFSLLFSSISKLSIELQGRTNFGGGALDTATFDIGKIMIVNPKILNNEKKKTLKKIIGLLLTTNFLPFSNQIEDVNLIKLDSFMLNCLDIQYSVKNLYQEILNIQNIRINRSNTYKI